MKGFITLTVLGLAAWVAAFPAAMTDPNSPLVKKARAMGLLDNLEERAEGLYKRAISTTAPQGTGALPLTPPPFDATAQYVSNTGNYAFVAPSSTDARGPCPGLNAMANHGYIPHNGVATITEFIEGTYAVFGMDTDLATFLAVYGAAVDGTLTSWSIAGVEHTGIGGSHNNYEADSSPLRADLSQYGSNTELVISQFNELFNLQPDASTANYNLEVLRDFRATRFQQSINDNPDYSYLPFAGILVSQAAFTFIYRFMANKSAEYPEGILNQDVLKSFMSITGTSGNFKWTPGHEKIPDNWYKRNDADLYSIAYFNTDILYFAETVPEILVPGCNQGQVNTYDTISASTLSGGSYTAADVAANPVCFAYAFATAEAVSLLGLSTTQATLLTTALGDLATGLGESCAAFSTPDFTALEACPGFSFYGGPTAPVAAGAIQS